MRKAITFGCLSIVALSAALIFATAQQGDILLLEGKKYSIYTNPLEPYLSLNPGKLPKAEAYSTANWRGYVATWQVKDNRLMLTDVGILHSVSNKNNEGDRSTEMRSVIAEMFPGQKEVLAEWFSGHVIIPNGQLVNYVHMGYASIYEKYILLRVEKGLVARKWESDTEAFMKFRDAQFSAFKKTDEYKKALAETNKEGGASKQNEEFIREFYSERYMSMIFGEAK